jgi:hypothetical protein
MMSLAHYPAERIDAMNRKQLLEFITLLFMDSVMKEKDSEIDTDSLSLMPALARTVTYWTLWFQTFWDSDEVLRADAKWSFTQWETTGTICRPS